MTRVLRDEAELRAVVREPSRVIAEKHIDHIDPESRRFIEASPFFLLASSAADGSCDVSPRGDPPGSVLVLDEHTLAFADRKGNRRLDNLCNILQQPQVGMLFLVPGIGDTLRVNGAAQLVTEAPYLPRMAVEGVVPVLAVEVRVQELYSHCGKAFLRSKLWDSASWPDRGEVPTAGQLARSQLGTHIPARMIDAALRADAKLNQY
ncbi:MSMEG_1061 family FMN-dependent PPOX-type flavoprotein [Amycolatopsis magusensis]|uniref:MSMEG_1061 family FMN-dependent PPOX-type flavoprotein n=1 Tax=Amycolatopsis magusensis TaxID=882444 RepID=UPI0024A7C995|nr:MSMEG_1061 family FMN-dependent PPOX-type flavoprotein [Amycolatopsis magusensis]MDI5977158.1 pyridoxamine 5'-phosphate oxidase family protein [Amycolatopsis magusensis]